LSPKNDWKRT